MSLGASRRDVMTGVIGDAGRLSAMGLALGLALAIPATQQVRSQLFGVEVLDPLTYLAVAVVLLTVALLASWIPARRAASISPVEALRGD